MAYENPLFPENEKPEGKCMKTIPYGGVWGEGVGCVRLERFEVELCDD